MWNRGSAATKTSLSLRPPVNQLVAWHALVTRLAWVSIAPLEVPVVPPVYCRQAMSEVFCGTGLGSRARLSKSRQGSSEERESSVGDLGLPGVRLERSARSRAAKLVG